MKELLKMIVTKMVIRNFKGIQDLTIDFKDITNIYAQNGGFKTTIADAWYYCLYGKDSHDRSDFNIKNTVNTNLNRGDHEVSIHINTGQNSDIFKRVYREVWTKPRGQKDQIYSGNETLYYCNDVPMSEKEYKGKIDSIIAEGALKLLTNPLHFNSLKWTDRRNILFELGGKVTDTEISGNRAEFVALLNSLSNKTIAEYKREVSAKKKKLKDDLSAIPHRISEVNRSLPEELEYSLIEAQIIEKSSAIEALDKSIVDKTTAFQERSKAIQDKQTEIHNLKTKINNIRFRIQTEMNNSENAIKSERKQLENNIHAIEQDIQSKSALILSSETKIKNLQVKTDQLRVEWENKNIEEIKFKDGEFSCPSCKRELEFGDVETKKSELKTNFNKSKERELDLIVANATNHNKEVIDTDILLSTLRAAHLSLKTELADAKNKLSEFENKNVVPMGEVSIEFKLAKDYEYVQLEGKLENLESEPDEKLEIDTTELIEQKKPLQAELDSLKSQLNTRIQRENALKRVSELENDESNISQQIADLENIEFTIDEFNRAKIETTEGRINGLFKYVTFKLFDKKINGDEFEVCETMYNGVPFSDLNTAGKIWAGIDIINTLSQFYGLSAPIFLDNRESVTIIPEINSQIINLIVSPEDKVLRVA